MLNHFSFIARVCRYRNSSRFIDDLSWTCTLAVGLPIVRFKVMNIAVKYGIDDLRYWTETVKNAVRFSFVNNIRF